MATTTNIGATGATSAVQPTVRQSNRRLVIIRALMLALVSSSLAFGIMSGLVAWQANVATYNDYHTIVGEGSVSVDAALRARAAALDHMSAAAIYLETKGQARQEAAARADQSWADFNEEARISWRNLSDPTHGESNVYAAADRAAGDYIKQIGAMFAYNQHGQTGDAGAAFLSARETMNTRLVPALGGLEAVKVEKMEATYAGADRRIANWRDATLVVGVLLTLIFLGMILAVRRMHYRWSWPIGAALVITLLLTLGLQSQLGLASFDARVLVREAYDNVAGVQDLAALLSQQRALNSIIVFNPERAEEHAAGFDQYATLVEQRLCGPRDCLKNTFLSGQDTIRPAVAEAAKAEQARLGLPRVPLVGNVHFAGQAVQYEQLRLDYQQWLKVHDTIKQQVEAGNLDTAAALSTGEGAKTFAKLQADTDAATQVARNKFDDIWQRVYFLTGVGQALALVFPLGGGLAALGLWRRRNELLA